MGLRFIIDDRFEMIVHSFTIPNTKESYLRPCLFFVLVPLIQQIGLREREREKKRPINWSEK